MCAPLTSCQLILTDNRGEHAFFSGNIIRLEAANNYTIVYFKDNRRPFIISKVLKVYEEMLSPYGFVRTHRSHLVNKQFIRCVTSDTIVMQDESVAELSRRNKKSIVQQLSAHISD